MRRLSKPITALKPVYDAIVIGSGYGGGVAASRLARAGRAVCVLERGREYVEGDFPETALEAAGAMQINNRLGRMKGDESDLFDVHIDREISVLRGCGLGGTSLINANVVLRAEPRVFHDPRWPAALRADIDDGLATGYRRAEAMLAATPYPIDRWPEPMKYRNLARSAEAMGEACYPPPLAVNFDVDGPNHVGVTQRPCVLCGDCVSGCNHAAKNTVAMTWLPDAFNHGAEMFTEAAVRRIAREGDRWAVWFEAIERGRDRFDDAPLMAVRAPVVVLAAGALGSTEILLRSRAAGLPTSDRLGEGFTGNGDVLGFSFDGQAPVNSIGRGPRSQGQGEPVGPCITGVIDLRRPDRPVEAGYVIEDGAPPGATALLASRVVSASAAAVGERTADGPIHAKARQLAGIALSPYEGPALHTQTYLVMAHDDGRGALHLEDDRLCIDWPAVGGQSIFERVADGMRAAAAAVQGTFVPNPVWSTLQEKSLVTVHPLGGCCMGDDAATGVVDHAGRVFDGQGGVHGGLYVADGAIVPMPVGVNPLLTISALAERSMMHVAADHGWTFDDHLPSRPPRAPALVEAVGVEFTERMAGFVAVGAGSDYDDAHDRGEVGGDGVSFLLTITVPDLDAFIADPDRRARAVGTVECPAVAEGPMTVTGGVFQLFSTAHDQVDTTEMWYRLPLTTSDGRRLFFEGFKTVRDDPGFDPWRDTTTLYATLRAGGPEGTMLARGRLHISPTDLARQLSTMRGVGSPRRLERMEAVARFGQLFAGDVWKTYGGIVAPSNRLDANAPPRKRRPLRAPTPELHPVTALDGVPLRLTRYRGGDKGPVMLVHGAGVSTYMFAVDTVETNLVEYLCAHGYDVWTFDWRTSIALPSADEQGDCDDAARNDFPAAIERIRAVTGAPDVQVFAHCVGALAFFISMLDGLEGVRSIVASQVSVHPVGGAMVRLKSKLFVPEILSKLGVESMTARTDAETGWLGRALDAALKLYPIEEEERCSSPVCRRITFMYNVLYEHDKLNAATHETLHELFGVGTASLFRHLAQMNRAEQLTDRDGEDVYLPHADRLKLPIRLITGAENMAFLPEANRRTLAWLNARNGEGLYDYVEIPDYGHFDCIVGKAASEDVFPHIVAHLERTARG